MSNSGLFGKLASKKVKIFKWRVKLVVVLILLFLLLAAGGLGYAFWFNKSDDDADTADTSQVAGGDTVSSTVTPTPTATPTPTPTPTPGGGTNQGSTPTPTPVATPASIVFAVTNVTAAAEVQTICSNEDNIVMISGNVTANASGIVYYHWLRSDGASGPQATLLFNSAGTQTVTTSWTMPKDVVTMSQPSIFSRFLRFFEGRAYALPSPDPVTYWQQIVVTTPNAISSNQASFARQYCNLSPPL
jgi:flagellar basal body-associated protein FliL